MDPLVETVVDALNVLGSGKCSQTGCEGCEYERCEVIHQLFMAVIDHPDLAERRHTLRGEPALLYADWPAGATYLTASGVRVQRVDPRTGLPTPPSDSAADPSGA